MRDDEVVELHLGRGTGRPGIHEEIDRADGRERRVTGFLSTVGCLGDRLAVHLELKVYIRLSVGIFAAVAGGE